MNIKFFSSLFFAFILTSCAWVELSPGGKKIRVLEKHEVKTCRILGTTTAKVKDTVAGLKRKEHLVAENLEMLARNAAAEMGGDTIVSVSEVNEGVRKYEVYKCVGN